MYFKSNQQISSRRKGFSPLNPQKRPEKNCTASKTKYNFSDTLQQDTQKCSEIEAAIEVVEIFRAIPNEIKTGKDILKFYKKEILI